jgi:3-oxoacyl-[acyl-carrier protein] reductase
VGQLNAELLLRARTLGPGYPATGVPVHAIHALTRTVSLKLAPGNRIVAIAPGIVTDSRMTQNRKEDDLALMTKQVPMQRLGHPRELAEITYFVLSDCCASMTGCTIDVNGANYLR